MSDVKQIAHVRFISALRDAKARVRTVNILVEGTYKPYTGHVVDVNDNMVILENEYSTEYLLLSSVKAVKVYG